MQALPGQQFFYYGFGFMYTGVKARYINVFDKNSLFLGMSLIAMSLYVKGGIGLTS